MQIAMFLEFRYDQAGGYHKLFGFTAVLGYSRMRFVTFTKRCDVASLIRCLMEACEYFGGLPQTMLTDHMKSILLDTDGTRLVWHPLFAEWDGTRRSFRVWRMVSPTSVTRALARIATSTWVELMR